MKSMKNIVNSSIIFAKWQYLAPNGEVWRYLAIFGAKWPPRVAKIWRMAKVGDSQMAPRGATWRHLAIKMATFGDSELKRNLDLSRIPNAETLLSGMGDSVKDTWADHYFRGHMPAKLKGQCRPALDGFKMCAMKAAHLKQIKILSYYEIGLCHMINWNWGAASDIFLDMRNEAKWSKLLYTYLAAVCMGASDRPEGSKHLFKELSGLARRTMNQELESYCIRKVRELVEGGKICALTGFSIIIIFFVPEIGTRFSSYILHNYPPGTPGYQANCISTGSDLRYECHLAALEILYIWRYLTFTEQQAEFMVHTVEKPSSQIVPETSPQHPWPQVTCFSAKPGFTLNLLAEHSRYDNNANIIFMYIAHAKQGQQIKIIIGMAPSYSPI
eukprot:sb/3479372/